MGHTTIYQAQVCRMRKLFWFLAGAYIHKRLYYACVKTYSRICTNTEEIARNHREIDKEQEPGTGLRFVAYSGDSAIGESCN